MMAIKVLLLLSVACALAQKVPVEIYTLSQCPFCAELVTGSLSQVVGSAGIPGIINMTFVSCAHPNSTVSKGQQGPTGFYSSHGQAEVVGDAYEQCSIAHSSGDLSVWYPYVECLAKDFENILSKGKSCLKGFPNAGKVQECVGSGEPNTLLGAEATAILTREYPMFYPKVRFVPTVFVAGKELNNPQDEGSFIAAICDAYTGSPKPAACSGIQRHPIRQNRVCSV
eukprot:Sspe_Gene.15133::Locus_5255_Transcript_1_1_Confidence_1.000_Length_858::g.15133::m.15133/K08059/IFI30, GILT; interferon, gamma-inducible protein 30